MKFKIEKNVPLPSDYTKSKYPLSLMKVKDSFFMKAKDDKERRVFMNRAYQAIIAYKKKNPKTDFIYRSYHNGIRVWRVK